MKADTVLVRGDTIREVEKRILIDFMDLLILSLACCYSGLVGGYDVLRFLQRRYRFLPSPGTVYSRLYELERRGLLRGSQNGRKRVYTPTCLGEETVKAVIASKDRIVKFVSMVLNDVASSYLRLQP